MTRIVTIICAVAFGAMLISDIGYSADAPAAGPKAQPASHAGRTTCLSCHKDGVAGAKKIPDNHKDRTDATCAGCHKASK